MSSCSVCVCFDFFIVVWSGGRTLQPPLVIVLLIFVRQHDSQHRLTVVATTDFDFEVVNGSRSSSIDDDLKELTRFPLLKWCNSGHPENVPDHTRIIVMKLFILDRPVDDIEHDGCAGHGVAVATLLDRDVLVQVNQYTIL